MFRTKFDNLLYSKYLRTLVLREETKNALVLHVRPAWHS